MGRDKASIRLPLDPASTGPTLAQRTADLLAEVCAPVLEVGPGHSSLPAVTESPAGSGPLAAMVAGWKALTGDGWSGPVLVVATDLPALTTAMLRWLVDQPGEATIVPVSGGRAQSLCARYSPAAMNTAAELVSRGERALTALIACAGVVLAGEDEWAAPAGGVRVLRDVDTPEDLTEVRRR